MTGKSLCRTSECALTFSNALYTETKHEAERTAYRSARAAVNNIFNGAELPKMDTLKKSRRELPENDTMIGI